MEIRKIGVIGAGQMGSGIAQVAAQSGYEVVLMDVEELSLKKGLEAIRRSLDRFLRKEKITQEEAEKALARIKTTLNPADFADCDLVVEAIVENESVKGKLFQTLDKVVKPEAVFASNTSSIPITKLASYTSRPERFIGMHFMNPVPLMKLVEVIRGYKTSDEVTRVVMATAEKMGKVPVEVNDYPGFVSNRVLIPMLNEAIQAVMEGVATPEAIDTVMKLGMNHPMGPLTLADFIGLDTVLAIMEVLHEGFGDSKYRPSPLLKKMVQAGLLGRKSGQGFYKYDEKGNKIG
ncbi:3-hydroxyacyl-CoA dehydrogenase family protein [Oceanithermus profundus]|uniref:3-hydroxyacyl-CoA dehydrogenase n=1 Tax=Oceanithermus profundus (strain DSM 14977 / NBRC 100410 / VKM B-2274 / 506) TaxID=670487 RepID=E4U4C2_OCEP5|nr:3-hydroxybutyryl-CoA dehydrogenase [Oceanithermus profundus]ADR36325.1 3-hydroxyacyl-CoA dehydrogenase [Oceanithermus profundus DSM 14977]